MWIPRVNTQIGRKELAQTTLFVASIDHWCYILSMVYCIPNVICSCWMYLRIILQHPCMCVLCDFWFLSFAYLNDHAHIFIEHGTGHPRKGDRGIFKVYKDEYLIVYTHHYTKQALHMSLGHSLHNTFLHFWGHHRFGRKDVVSWPYHPDAKGWWWVWCIGIGIELGFITRVDLGTVAAIGCKQILR